MTLLVWTAILLLVLVNAFYVAAEFAAVAVRRGQVRELADQGHRIARRLLPLLEDTLQLDRFIAGCQIGITLSSLVLGAFAQATVALAVADRLEAAGWERLTAISTAATGVLVGITVLQVVFGELVPKSLALQSPVRVALLTYLPMRWSMFALSWFIAILNGSGNLILRALGVQPGTHRHVHSPEEIDLLLVESADGGLLEADEQRRLHDALRLSSRTARELMTPRIRVEMIDGAITFAEILRQAGQSAHTRIPVFRERHDNIVGFIHTRDLVARLAAQQAATLEDVLRPLLAVPDTLRIHQLLPLLRKRGQRMALVVDEYGSAEGIVTLQDVLDELLGTPPAVGQLSGQPVPEKLDDGRWRLPGLLPLADLERLLGYDWRDPQVTTLGGFILKRVPHLPRVGETVAVDGVTFEVEQLDRQMIGSLLVTLPPDRSEKEER